MAAMASLLEISTLVLAGDGIAVGQRHEDRQGGFVVAGLVGENHVGVTEHPIKICNLPPWASITLATASGRSDGRVVIRPRVSSVNLASVMNNGIVGSLIN